MTFDGEISSVDPMMLELFQGELIRHLGVIQEQVLDGAGIDSATRAAVISDALTSIGSAACIIQLGFVAELTSAICSAMAAKVAMRAGGKGTLMGGPSSGSMDKVNLAKMDMVISKSIANVEGFIKIIKASHVIMGGELEGETCGKSEVGDVLGKIMAAFKKKKQKESE